MLRVSSIALNLASVHKFCHDNNCWCYFDENILSIQALTIGNVIYQGKSEQGVYPIYPHKTSNLSLPSRAYNTVATQSFTLQLWHRRLGHPSHQVLASAIPSLLSSANKCNNILSSCTHCLHGKMHRLPFSTSQFVAHSPFELVHSDVWGPVPVDSINKYKYYVIFVDHFTRFT